tara:strand:- start:385 stop:2556 length:2172 start_codon:yes stop_codon:yes gene_type:complete
MSTRRVQGSAIKPRTLGVDTAWGRNPSWLALTAVSDSDQRFRGLVAVFPQGTYLALLATTSSGTYTVDWGDGNSENVASNTQANKFIDYNDADLNGTNAPVTLTDAGDLVERTAHGYSDGMEVRFYNIVSTTGLTTAQVYYVINATANNFQVSTTVRGSAVTLTTNGTATLLPYKQAIVNVTPTTANLSTFSLNRLNSTTGLNVYETGWLDIEFSGPNLTASGLVLGGVAVRFAMCERAAIRHIGSCTSFAKLFQAFRALREVVITASTSAVTNMSSMFISCSSLRTVPLFNTAGVTGTSSVDTGMNAMFSGCSSLVSVPLFNTASVVNMASTFLDCGSIVSVPLFNTAAVVTMASMFENCRSLASVPLFNTASVTTMLSTFRTCTSLTTVPLFNTVALTSLSSTFNGCTNLASVPLFNTASVTVIANMFTNCSALTTVPLFNTVLASNWGAVFNGCTNLASVPLFNTAAATAMANLFNGCSSLAAVPALNVSAITSAANFATMFSTCPSLARIEAMDFKFTFSVASCRLGKTQLEEIFTNLPTVASSQTITISTNVGLGTSVTARSTTTTAQSTTSTIANTASLANGMLVIGTGTGISTGITTTSDVSADTLTLTNHGLPDGTPIAFSSLGTTTGVSLWTIYYVRDTAADTFKIAATAGGAALDLTGTGGSMVVRYANYITSITTNTSIVTSTPMASSGTNNLDYRAIDTASALLKNWAVTY